MATLTKSNETEQKVAEICRFQQIVMKRKQKVMKHGNKKQRNGNKN